MDYSLLLGIHDCVRGEQERVDEPENNGDAVAEEEEDSEDCAGDRTQWVSTPPDSPHALMREISLQYDVMAVIPELDIYAIPSTDSKYHCAYVLINKIDAYAMGSHIAAFLTIWN